MKRWDKIKRAAWAKFPVSMAWVAKLFPNLTWDSGRVLHMSLADYGKYLNVGTLEPGESVQVQINLGEKK